MYIFLPGGRLFIEAANTYLGDQLMFGSSHPFRPMKQSVEDYEALGFKDDVLEKVMWANAARLFNL